MSYPLRAAAAVTALGLAGAAVWTFSSGSSDTDADRKTVALGRIAKVALTTRHDCADLLSYYRTQAARVAGPYGLDGSNQIYTMSDIATDAARSKAMASGAPEGSGSAPPDSATNVQVAGVDESDIVKTDGDLMVAIINGEVRITRLAGAKTKKLATWRPAKGAAQSVLLDGGIAVVIGDRNGGIPLGATKMRPPGPDGYSSAVTDLTVLDLADPAHPRPVRQLELSGTRSGEARLVDGELRLALTAAPTGIAWEQPEYRATRKADPVEAEAEYKRSESRAAAANKRLIAKSTINDWIPQATVTPLNADGEPDGPVVRRPLLDCEQIAIPGSFSGLGTLALVSTDLKTDNPLTTWRSAGVISQGSTVYATADHVWLATSRWDAMPIEGPTSFTSRFRPSAASTQIHRFDTPLRAQPEYVASGEIAGSLLSQFSMDEKDGLLRVASTTDGAASAASAAEDSPLSSDTSATGGGPATKSGVTGEESPGSAGPDASGAATDIATPSAGEQPETEVRPSSTSRQKPVLSQGRVTVLTVDGAQLTQVGVVTGLGVGERIRGVRFMDDVGYVVTYRQTDPLYTVDLSDPANPRVRGELAVLGYSAYLHPAGEGRLLGLGQDGTKDGRTTGLQLSLFDVSDLDSPRRMDRERLAGAWSDAEGDHHAFTMAGDLVLIPYSSWGSAQPSRTPGEAATVDGDYLQRFDAGVIAVRVGPDGLGTPTTLRPIASGPVSFDGSRQTSPSIQRVFESAPLRTVVHDGTIYTLTQSGVAAHSAADFGRLTFAGF